MRNCLKDIVYGIKSGIKNEESNMWLVCLSHGAKNVDMLNLDNSFEFKGIEKNIMNARANLKVRICEVTCVIKHS